MSEDFTKLYIDEKQDADKIWPPFADMMTVISMIFMLTMSVAVLKNWDLVEKLQASLVSERELTHKFHVQTEEKYDLSSRLSDRENELAVSQMQALNLQGDLDNLQQENAKLVAQLDSANNQLHLNQEKIAADKEEFESIKERYIQQQEELERAKIAENQARETIKTNEQDLARLTKETKQLNNNLVEAEEKIVNFEKKTNIQEQAYSQLKVKYERLIRPARSAKGKIIVEIRCAKVGEKLEILYRGSNDANFAKKTKEQLYSALDKLKEQNPNLLYLKIVFPKGDDISYSDAWKFTSDLLSRYDYYYQ